MQDSIKQQLEHCSYANIGEYDAVTHTYHIPKYTKPGYKIGSCYLVKVAGSIVKNANSVMATNWNHGSAPQLNYLKIYVSKALGKNVYVDSIGYDINTNEDTNILWSGWLCTDDLEQIKSL